MALRSDSVLLPPLSLLLLLGAQLAVAASTKLISKLSWEPRSMMSPCGLDEYPSASNCCRRCPAGQYVREPCSSTHTQSECATCDEGTFTAFPNGLRSCVLCSSCSEDQEVVAECTPTSNRKCQCQTGRYRHPDSNEFCAPCSPCPQGKVVLRTCNATADTVCGLPGPGKGLVSLLLRPKGSAPFRSLHENPGANSPGPRNRDISLDVPCETPMLPRTPESPAGVQGPQPTAGEGLGPTPPPPPARLNQADRSV
ncbi:uncharacterized protein WM277_026273 isoform 2-T2 [Molossus nigricans]